MIAVERYPPRQSRGVREQLSDGQGSFVAAPVGGQMSAHGVGERQSAALDQLTALQLSRGEVRAAAASLIPLIPILNVI